MIGTRAKWCTNMGMVVSGNGHLPNLQQMLISTSIVTFKLHSPNSHLLNKTKLHIAGIKLAQVSIEHKFEHNCMLETSHLSLFMIGDL